MATMCPFSDPQGPVPHASNIRRQGPGPHRLILVRRRPGRLARRQRRPRRPQPHPTDISAWLRILVGTCQASASITWLISEPAALRRLLQAEHWGRWRRRCPGRAPEQVPGRTWAKRIQWRAEGQRSRTRVTPRPGTAARHRSLFCGAGVREGRGRVGLLGGNGVHHQVALVAATFGVVRWGAGDQGQDRPSVAPEHLLGEMIPVDHLARLHLVLDGGASWRATVTASPLRTL